MVLRALAKWNPRVELACTLTSRETRPGNRKQSFLYMVAKVTTHRPLKLSTLSVICIFFYIYYGFKFSIADIPLSDVTMMPGIPYTHLPRSLQ